MTRIENKTFILYSNYEPMINALSDEAAGQLLKAIYSYHSTGDIPDSDDMDRTAFALLQTMIPLFDESLEKYKETCKRNALNSWKKNNPEKYKKKLAEWDPERYENEIAAGELENGGSNYQNENTAGRHNPPSNRVDFVQPTGTERRRRRV